MKQTIILIIVTLFFSCKERSHESNTIPSEAMKVNLNQNSKTKIAEDVPEGKTEKLDSKEQIDIIENIEKEKQKKIEIEKQEAVMKGENCETVLKNISDAIDRLNKSGDNQNDLNFLNTIGDDALYIDCLNRKEFLTKVEKLYENWN